LEDLVEPHGTNLRQEDIDDEFLKLYVEKLSEAGIRVAYNLPVTMTKDTLEQGMIRESTAD